MTNRRPFHGLLFFFQLLIKSSKRISIETAGKRTLTLEITRFKGDSSKESEEIALQSREILQAFVYHWGTRT